MAASARWLLCCAGFVLGAVVSPTGGHAADYVVDPVRGTDGGAGTAAAPWHSLQAALDDERLKPGDTVSLRTGEYGTLTIRGKVNARPVTIAAARGQTPRFDRIGIVDSRNWRLRGLHVRPPSPPRGAHVPMLAIDDSEDIVIEDCTLSSADDVSTWSDSDWRERAYDGISASGGRAITLRGNRIRNIKHGISTSADDSLVERNVIENFGGDGIRGLGNNTVYQYNMIKNCYKIDDNHDDGFQSWSRGPLGPGTGVVKGGVLRGNVIINYEDANQPLRGTLQGIGMFDGMFEDWIIENNFVIVDHWHGITVMGARNVRIVNNTVLDPNDQPPGPPWISITHHKDGRSPENCVIANNLAPARAASRNNTFGLPKPGVTAVNNLDVRHPMFWFVDPRHGDLRLRADSPAIDAGAAEYAPPIDIVGTPRPQGAGVDVGAFEFRPGGQD